MNTAKNGSKIYRTGIIGCGDIGSHISERVQFASHRQPLPFGHAPTYLSIPRIQLVAAADIDSNRALSFAEKWDVPKAGIYTDYRNMLENEHLDLLGIASPTPLHAEMAICGAEHGVRGIFLEKPIASSIKDARDVLQTCKKFNIPLAINHLRRADQYYRKAHQLLNDGLLGTLHSLVGSFRGGLMWNGTHMFDLLNYFSGDGDIAWMSGHLDSSPSSRDPGGSAYIVYQNGVRAFINASEGNSVDFRLHIIGTQGEIIIGNYELELYRRNPEGSRGELLKYPFPQVLPATAPMVTLVNELIDSIEGGPVPCSNGETGLKALELIVGLHNSSDSGSNPVKIPDDLDDTLTIISG